MAFWFGFLLLPFLAAAWSSSGNEHCRRDVHSKCKTDKELEQIKLLVPKVARHLEKELFLREWLTRKEGLRVQEDRF